MTALMNVVVNGKAEALPEGSTLDTLLRDPRGVAVAVNSVVVPASRWSATVLRPHDAVEVVTAHQGG
jgi:sulfur carrier protein